ncbi:Translation initiation factor eif-2b subunit beta [Dirofilaria immitis]|nr:Translation initiation factor eif-2b subunit beta [Dirofilaria immitis]
MDIIKKGIENYEMKKEIENDSARRLFIYRIQQISSQKIAVDTLTYIRKIVDFGKYSSAKDLIELLETERKLLLEALPYQFELWKTRDSRRVMDPRELRKSVVVAINEFATEIDTCVEDICAQASDHICTSDVIITHSLSLSATLRAFFKSARKSQKNFRLLVVDEEIDYGDCLSSVDILTAMQRATRVFISAVAVFPDGSCLAPAGCLMICLAAKRHAVPVCVSDVDRIYSFGSANDVVSFTEMEEMGDVQIVNPIFDLISAELILQYISHTSAFTPSHVYRFIEDYYCHDRIELSFTANKLMAEPGDAIRVDDVEDSSDDEEEGEGESSMESDESSAEESSSEDQSEEKSSDDDVGDDTNVWDSVDDGAQTEEAVEASLQADYTIALNLIIDGHKQKAFTIMEKLLQHSILQKFEVNINLFNWNEARKEACANQSRVSAMARLFHLYISILALTVYPNDEYLWKYVGEESLKIRDWSMALYAFGNCSSTWSVIRGTLIALYNANLFEDCLLKIKSILELDRTYFLGRVLKEIIRETNSYWEMKCCQIFKEDPVFVQDEDVILSEITNTGKSIVYVEPVFKPVVINVSSCSNLAEVGIYLCDIYDRIESFSSFTKQTIVIYGTNVWDEFEELVHDASNDLMDCVNVIQDLVDRIVSVEAMQPASNIVSCANFYVFDIKRKQSDSGLDWRRRSVRFRAEFNIEESGSENDQILIASLLNYSCAQESSIIPLLLVKPSSLADSNGRIFEILEQLLFWYSKNCFCIIITDNLRESWALIIYQLQHEIGHLALAYCYLATGTVIVGCYARWITNFGNTSMFHDDGYPSIHTMLAELGSEKAMFICYSLIFSSSLEQELRIRILWAIAINGTSTFPFQVCKNHLWLLLAALKSSHNSEVKYQSLINGHELINLETVQNLIAQMERRENLEAIQRLFDNRQFDKVIDIIIDNFSWKDVDRSALLSTAMILIDSYLELSNMDGASEWISRLLDFTRGFAGTEEVVARVKRLAIENICLENISNLVHCIVHLLVLGGYESDATLWLVLYRCAFHLEGELTVETLSALYDDGCQMLTSASNILVTAHEAIAKHGKCFINNQTLLHLQTTLYRLSQIAYLICGSFFQHSFPLFVLNEFSKIRAHPAIVEVLSVRDCVEQSRAFMDEVHQCLFCLYGCPSKRKRQLEEHGGTHNHEPSLKDIENVLSLLLPDKIPPYDGTCSFDLIEFMQKKASSFWNPQKMKKKSSSRLITLFRKQRFTQIGLDVQKVDEDEMSLHFDSSVFSFRMALFLIHLIDMLYLTLVALYIKSIPEYVDTETRFIAHSIVKLSVDDIRHRWADRRLKGLLEESRRQFEICIPRLPDGDVDKWRCHYFLAKIAEKCDDGLEDVFHHYHESALQLEAAGVQYPSRINIKRQEHAEAIEMNIYFYPLSCLRFLVKYLLERGADWNREDLMLMHAFAMCFRKNPDIGFRNHGVCKQKGSDEFSQCPQVKATVRSLIYICTESNDPVQGVLEDLIEQTVLKLEILHICEEAFSICIRRFPHFKSYYRLSQLALYKGDVREASNYLFGRFLVRKRTNFNQDNIFEYHLARISALAIYLSSLLGDFEALATLIHTFCTLDFCNNTDYLLRRDLMMLYRNSLVKFFDCIQQKMRNNAVESRHLCSIYDLYQYAERNGAQRLCKRIRPLIVSATKNFAGYDEKIEPILFCKQLYIASKRRLGKRKLSSSSIRQAKSFCLFSNPNSCLAFT